MVIQSGKDTCMICWRYNGLFYAKQFLDSKHPNLLIQVGEEKESKNLVGDGNETDSSEGFVNNTGNVGDREPSNANDIRAWHSAN